MFLGSQFVDPQAASSFLPDKGLWTLGSMDIRVYDHWVYDPYQTQMGINNRPTLLSSHFSESFLRFPFKRIERERCCRNVLIIENLMCIKFGGLGFGTKPKVWNKTAHANRSNSRVN